MDDAEQRLTRRVTSTQTLVHGPVCRVPTRRLHRRAVRTGAALPWGPWRVVLHLHGRQFCCANGRGIRRMLPERRAPLVAPWARRTPRLVRWRGHIAVALAGPAGARVRRALGLDVGRHTLLRLLRRLPLPAVATPHVLGVDDGAARKRPTSGPVRIDRERPRPLALLPEREATTFALW